MLDDFTKRDIEKISLDLLKGSKSLDVFPTPVQQIISHSDLALAQGINIPEIEEKFFSKVSGSFQSMINKIRGILDREEKLIYIDLNQRPSRQNFVKLHEVGHQVLTWQEEMLACLDTDDTLSHETKEQMEAEANYFASVTLFQHDRFDDKLKGLPLGIESAMHLSKVFGASNHAALRRYVEHSNKRCSLLVLENISKKGEFPKCGVKDYFQSKSFTKNFGNITWTKDLGYTWTFVKDYYHGRRMVKAGCIELESKNGKSMFSYEFFNNTWNAFVLFYPVGETNKSRVRFIVKP